MCHAHMAALAGRLTRGEPEVSPLPAEVMMSRHIWGGASCSSFNTISAIAKAARS